jgi:hypothetical protein
MQKSGGGSGGLAAPCEEDSVKAGGNHADCRRATLLYRIAAARHCDFRAWLVRVCPAVRLAGTFQRAWPNCAKDSLLPKLRGVFRSPLSVRGIVFDESVQDKLYSGDVRGRPHSKIWASS